MYKYIFVALLFASTALGQHVPSLTVAGRTVTIDADIAWFDTLPDGFELLKGTTLSSPGILASSDGESPIVFRAPAGTYNISAFGFPADRKKPVREFKSLTASLTPTRQDNINWTYANVVTARDQYIVAAKALTDLTPTTQEIIAALNAYITSTTQATTAKTTNLGTLR